MGGVEQGLFGECDLESGNRIDVGCSLCMQVYVVEFLGGFDSECNMLRMWFSLNEKLYPFTAGCISLFPQIKFEIELKKTVNLLENQN